MTEANGAGAGAGQSGQAGAGEKMISQSEVQKIIDSKYSEWKSKTADYDDLKKFKMEHEKSLESQKEKQLEEQRKYDELKQGWSAKEQQYQTALSAKDNEIKNIRVSNSLSSEVMKQNAYPEAILAMREMVVVKDDGSIIVKGKDANGIDKELSLEEGVKLFLKDRPHLVKAGAGGGTGTGGQGGSSGQGAGQDQNLANELNAAINSGDRKKVAEIKQKIRSKHTAMGVS